MSSFYLTKRAFWILGIAIVFFLTALLVVPFLWVGKLVLVLWLLAIIAETILLYSSTPLIDATRYLPKALSNGDLNEVKIRLHNYSKINLALKIKEDLPDQLQLFKWEYKTYLKPKSTKIIKYEILPTVRGTYKWYNTYAWASLAQLSLVARKVTFDSLEEIPCLPSFFQFQNQRLLNYNRRFQQADGIGVRKLGQSLEFEQIKTYQSGDDFRHINWKASAKKGSLMLNQYQDERSQEVYCVLDQGRAMNLESQDQSLFEYAINAALGLSRVVIEHKDKPGIISFEGQKCQLLKPRGGLPHFRRINEFLFQLSLDQGESSYELLYKYLRHNLKQRSLLVLFTHFDNIEAATRNVPYLRSIARFHGVILVLFKRKDLEAYAQENAETLSKIYSTTIAQEQVNQQQVLTRELQSYGIKVVLTTPQELSIHAINQYLKLKNQNFF